MSRINWHWFHKIAKGRGEWLTLLFSLLLALFIWTIHNLSLNYSTYVQYDLHFRTNIEGRVMEADAEDAAMMRVKASGYSLLAHRLYNQVDIELNPKYFHQMSPESDTFLVYVSEIEGELEKLLIENVKAVENYTTEFIRVVLPAIKTKKVPVLAQMQLDYSPQYMAISEMALSPDSILISGEEEVVARIDAVYTKIISKKNIDKGFQGVANLIPVNGVDMSHSYIYYSQQVGRYIEQTIELPINIVNVPMGKELLPMVSKVNVVYRQLLSSHSSHNEREFSCVVDYNDVARSINSQVKLHLVKAPAGIYSVTFDPPCVDCIIIDK
jgi:hypothetical protein